MVSLCPSTVKPNHTHKPLRTTAPPRDSAAKDTRRGAATAVRRAPLTLPLLVLPRCCLFEPFSPLDVASTDDATVAVFRVRVIMVVANVCVKVGVDSSSTDGVMKTSATAGAGTGMAQVCCV